MLNAVFECTSCRKTRNYTITHILCAAVPANALDSQRRRWVQILEAHGRSDAQSLVEGVESVGELVDKTELLDASSGMKDELVDMEHDDGT